MKNVVFITKDAQARSFFPIYGNTFWDTPNINILAQNGTVFFRHYSAGTSTAMTFTSMAIGNYCYTTNRKTYSQVPKCSEKTIFDMAYQKGYECHIVWDSSYLSFAQKYFRCEGEHTIIHNIEGLIPKHSPHIVGVFDDLTFDKMKENKVYESIDSILSLISNTEKPIFLWVHLPHVLNGRNSYGSDIDMLDNIIGIVRKYYEDDTISISTDHGNMDGFEGKFGYGFDTHESVINIPFITPRLNTGESKIYRPTSTTQLFEILFEKKVSFNKFVYSETAYYAQPKRKIAIISDNYKLEFDKFTNRFRLFDIEWDPFEKYNLYYPEFYDIDRKRWYSLNQRFFYPYWNKAGEYKKNLHNEFLSIYRKASPLDEFFNKGLYILKNLYIYLFVRKKPKKKITNSSR